MKRRKSRETDGFTVSFLDVASCGFGAMIILLMITKSSAPATIEFANVTSDVSIMELQEQLFTIRGDSTILNREMDAKHEQLSALTERIARLRRDMDDIQGRFQTSRQLSDTTIEEIGRLAIARQTLTEEMERILPNSTAPPSSLIGGIPVDSEYFIFVIDTSGSMFNSPSWNKMLGIIEETLTVYPLVKGIQVMNDMGRPMFDTYRNQWIPDTPERRDTIISTLRTWGPYSNSSPVEGITAAIRNFQAPDKKISIYVLGDDFQPDGSVANVIQEIDNINVEDANGDRLVRIHAIGFPNIFHQRPPTLWGTADKFINLMRELTERNGGTFIAIHEY
mgnify:CR=1 FL=1